MANPPWRPPCRASSLIARSGFSGFDPIGSLVQAKRASVLRALPDRRLNAARRKLRVATFNHSAELHAMSDLVVLDFDGVVTADEVLTKLRGMQKEHLIDLEDACLVVHTENGKVQIKQAMNLTAFGAARGQMPACWSAHSQVCCC